MRVLRGGNYLKMTLYIWVIIGCSTLWWQLAEAKPPNILFIVADDLGWNDVGWRNKDVITPNLDKLAREGVILNQTYVQPVCSPSRNAFMTGYYPFHTGLQHQVIQSDEPYGLPLNFTLLPRFLKKAGYRTHIVGKWHLGFCAWPYTPTYRGFDTYFGYYTGAEDYYTHHRGDGLDLREDLKPYKDANGTYSANLFAKRASQVIAEHDPSTPFFLYLPFQSVHAPLQVPKRFSDMYAHINNHERRMYCGMVSALDEAIGNITTVLEQKKLLDDLVIIFTTDNGGPSYFGANNWPLRGCKTTLWEGGTRGSAFVWSRTFLKKQGYVNEGMIHAVDWFPTILHLAGLKPEPGIDGMNQWETISEDQPSPRHEFVYNIDEIKKSYSIRMGDYKLIVGSAGHYNGWYPPPHFEGDEPDMLPEDLPLPDSLQVRLFNIKEDPTEHHDIAKKRPDIVKKMQKRLAEYMKTLHPAFNPKSDPKSDPKYWGGVWSPGWCKA